MKDLKHYMGLNYTIELRRLSKQEGGGWLACIPRLGRFTCRTDADTPTKAVRRLDLLKRELFKDYLKKGIKIPELG